MSASQRIDLCVSFLLLLAGVLTACSSLAPATAPPQLRQTPGAYIVITNGHVNTGRYRLDYPASWKLVKQSAADAAFLQLDLISPDGGKVSLLDIDTAGAAVDRVIPLAEGNYLQVIVEPADETDAAFASQVEQLVNSIRK